MDNPIPPRHRKKQRKSKTKTTETEVPEVPTETSKQFSKRELSSNWKKYEDNTPTKDIDVDVPRASDFGKLLSAPASVGGHFQFKSEKNWEGTDYWYNLDYFQLNLLELSNSLTTIPFYERQNYPQDIFSSKEIEDMTRQAKFQYFKWSDNLSKVSPIDGEGNINETPTAGNLPQNDEDDLDELLNLPGPKQPAIRSAEIPSGATTTIKNSVTSPSGQATTTSSATDDSTDIQKWLDDVLVLDS